MAQKTPSVMIQKNRKLMRQLNEIDEKHLSPVNFFIQRIHILTNPIKTSSQIYFSLPSIFF